MTQTTPPARSVLKWSLPIDDEFHAFTLTGPIIHVGSQSHDPHSVQLWEWANPSATPISREFRVYGTGHPTPPSTEVAHIGSVIAPHPSGAEFVWHVFERFLHGAMPQGFSSR